MAAEFSATFSISLSVKPEGGGAVTEKRSFLRLPLAILPNSPMSKYFPTLIEYLAAYIL